MPIISYAPRQEKDNRFYYTRYALGGSEVERVGYCVPPCTGHDSTDEARAHFLDYLRENIRYVKNHYKEVRYVCRVPGCQHTTHTAAYMRKVHIEIPLCKQHANFEGLEKVLHVEKDVMVELEEGKA